MTEPNVAKNVEVGTEPGENPTARESHMKPAEPDGPTRTASAELTPGSILSDSRLLRKIDTSVEDQLSLAKLSYGILGKISDQLNRQAEESLVRAQRPMLLELVLFHDNLQGAIEWARGSNELSTNDIVNRLEILEIELLEVLSRKDVRPFEEHPISLDPKLHRTVKTLPTPDLKENNTVAQIVRTGFFWGEKVLRPEEVVVKKYAIRETQEGA
jgi:molecular chaperone GrpE (heat shock protein)